VSKHNYSPRINEKKETQCKKINFFDKYHELESQQKWSFLKPLDNLRLVFDV